jgi:hypothetical protein
MVKFRGCKDMPACKTTSVHFVSLLANEISKKCLEYDRYMLKNSTGLKMNFPFLKLQTSLWKFSDKNLTNYRFFPEMQSCC